MPAPGGATGQAVGALPASFGAWGGAWGSSREHDAGDTQVATPKRGSTQRMRAK